MTGRTTMNIRIVGLFMSLLWLGGCGATPPVVDYDKGVDFSSYHSFAFISDHPLLLAAGSPSPSPFLEERLMRATAQNLQAKGFVKADHPEAADFVVAFTIGARDKIQVNSFPEPYRPIWGGRGWGGAYYGGANVDVQQYTEGQLAIDMYDVSGRKAVWHGVATKRITKSMQRNADEATTEIVNNILMDFPPGSGKPPK